ncbi:MAG: hypothetical protein ACREQ5_16040, partial [Candidatus Dormibacteria bacterium]
MANWEEIRQALSAKIQLPPALDTTKDLDVGARQLEESVQQILKELIPPPKPFPYAKRWWSLDLTIKRRDYNWKRNQWTASQRRGDYDVTLRDVMHSARRSYFTAIETQKKKHWREFLDDNQNVWTALKYLGGMSKKHTIPPLQGQGHVVEEESEKAELLLQTFFPSQPEPQLQPQLMTQPEEEPSLHQLDRDIQESEIHWAIFNSNPRKAPGPDDIPFCVWQELWPVVKEWIVHIYRRSIQLGHLPTPWAEAKIVVIQKPGKPDYSIANAYRPISLLRTISKGLEKVIARRLSEYLERTAKLPRTQFGARPRRSAEQALMILVERIYGAWRAKNVLSLVT